MEKERKEGEGKKREEKKRERQKEGKGREGEGRKERGEGERKTCLRTPAASEGAAGPSTGWMAGWRPERRCRGCAKPSATGFPVQSRLPQDSHKPSRVDRGTDRIALSSEAQSAHPERSMLGIAPSSSLHTASFTHTGRPLWITKQGAGAGCEGRLGRTARASVQMREQRHCRQLNNGPSMKRNVCFPQSVCSTNETLTQQLLVFVLASVLTDTLGGCASVSAASSQVALEVGKVHSERSPQWGQLRWLVSGARWSLRG